MTLQTQIINLLLNEKRDFFINTAYKGYGNFGQPGDLYFIDTRIQEKYDGTILLAKASEDYEPSMRLMTLHDRYARLDVKKTSFDSEQERNSEIKRLLNNDGYKNRLRNRRLVEKALGSYLDELEAIKQEEILLNGREKIVEIPLEEVYHITLAIDDKLSPIWTKRKDKDRLAIDGFSDICSDEELIHRFKFDNPATFTDHIKNRIATVGKDVFLSEIIDDNEYRVLLIESFLEDGDEYSLFKSINNYVNNRLEKSLENAIGLNGLKFYNDFHVPYNRVKIINNLTSAKGSPFIEARTKRASIGYGFTRGMLNSARRVKINAQSVYQKSREEIIEIIKPLAVEHFNRAKTIDGGIVSYSFSDLFERRFEISLQELGLKND